MCALAAKGEASCSMPLDTLGHAVDAEPTNSRAGIAYVYRWDRHGRKGQHCRVTARGKMNSCRVEFDDGFVMITSRNAIKKA